MRSKNGRCEITGLPRNDQGFCPEVCWNESQWPEELGRECPRKPTKAEQKRLDDEAEAERARLGR